MHVCMVTVKYTWSTECKSGMVPKNTSHLCTPSDGKLGRALGMTLPASSMCWNKRSNILGRHSFNVRFAILLTLCSTWQSQKHVPPLLTVYALVSVQRSLRCMWESKHTHLVKLLDLLCALILKKNTHNDDSLPACTITHHCLLRPL